MLISNCKTKFLSRGFLIEFIRIIGENPQLILIGQKIKDKGQLTALYPLSLKSEIICIF
jgi:hypothetical protein